MDVRSGNHWVYSRTIFSPQRTNVCKLLKENCKVNVFVRKYFRKTDTLNSKYNRVKKWRLYNKIKVN